MLGKHPEITALFAVNDKMAIGALHYATRNNLAVPKDLSIVGFDNLRHAAFMNPSLSTVHLPLHEVGARACERLIERINGRTEATDDRLPTHLVVRNSTEPGARSRSAAGFVRGIGRCHWSLVIGHQQVVRAESAHMRMTNDK